MPSTNENDIIYIVFADGGWIRFDTYDKTILASGDDWQTCAFNTFTAKNIFCAVEKRQLEGLMKGFN